MIDVFEVSQTRRSSHGNNGENDTGANADVFQAVLSASSAVVAQAEGEDTSHSVDHVRTIRQLR